MATTTSRRARAERLRVFLATLAFCSWLPTEAPALTIYAPGSGPEDQLLQMFDVVTVPDPDAPREPVSPGTLGRSGSPGDASVLVEIGRNVALPNPAKYYAVTGLGIEERSNNPCLLTLWGGMVDPRYATSTRKLASFELGKCRKKNPLSTWVDFKRAGFDHPDHEFVRSVRVCGGHATFLLPQEAHSSTAWEIKGLSILPGLVTEGREEITALPAGETFVRPNCPEKLVADAAFGPGWSGWSHCPAGQLLTALTVHHFEGRFFTDFTVRCKSARSIRAESAPVKDATGHY